MKKNYLKMFITAIAVFFTFAYGNAQTLQWYKNWNSSGTQIDKGFAIAYDNNGNVYVTGQANISGSSYIETIKYNISGVPQWTTSYLGASGSVWQIGTDIAVDATGYVWVSGSITDGSGDTHLALIKYKASTGAIQTNYPKIYNSSSSGKWARGTCLAVYDSSDVYIGGSNYDGTNWDLIVCKDLPGSPNWAWTTIPAAYANTTQAEVTDLKINSNNTLLYATGNYYAGSTNNEDIVVAALYANNGTGYWAKTWNGSASNYDFANALTIDKDNSNDVYVCGYTTNSSSYKQGLLLKYSYSGTFIYQTIYTTSLDSYWNAIDISPSSNGSIIFVGGTNVTSTNPSEDYILGAYNGTNGTLYSNWGANNPAHYNGGLTTDLTGTNEGWAVSYEATTNRVYISGRSDTAVGGINITTIGYYVPNGHHTWEGNFNYNSSKEYFGADRIFCKYSMKTFYSSCYQMDFIDVVGESFVTATNGYDYVTLEYGASGLCTEVEGSSRHKDDIEQSQAIGLYPNPFTTTAILKLSPETTLNNAVLSIYDISGKLVSSVNNITSANISINRGNLKNGLYFYTLTDNGNVINKGKFIIAEE
jgi:hypothetical protein